MLSLDSIFDLEITVPFYSEHCVLHLHRREERRGSELQGLAHGEVVSCELCLGLLRSDSLLTCSMKDLAAPDKVVDPCMLPMLHHLVF